MENLYQVGQQEVRTERRLLKEAHAGGIAAIDIALLERLEFGIARILGTEVGISQVAVAVVLDEPDVGIARPPLEGSSANT